MNQHCGQLLLDWIRRRGGLKVKLGSNPHRGRSIADPDSPLVGVLDAMAERKNVTVSAAKGYAALKKTLQVVDAKDQTGQLPKAFSTFEEADSRFYPDRDLENWITVVQVPSSVVVALAFVAGRIHRSHVSHAIHLLLKLMMQVTDEDELNLTVSDFVDKASTLSKLVERGARTDDFSFLKMLCTRECAIRIGEFWETLKSQYSGTNNMINRTVTVRQLREKISNTSMMNMGSLNQSHPPGNSTCLVPNDQSVLGEMGVPRHGAGKDQHDRDRNQGKNALGDPRRRGRQPWLRTLALQRQDASGRHPWPIYHHPGRLGRLGVHEV